MSFGVFGHVIVCFMQQYTERPFIGDDKRKGLKIYPELLQELLLAREIETEEEAEKFLNIDYEKGIHDPFLMKDMDRAVSRVLSAISKKEKIVIYSDYDCDGIPGGVLLHDFFNLIGYQNFSNYIPHRHKEGYGINIQAVEKIKEEDKADLIITVDVGITDVDQVARANELGMDVIITDHHLPGDVLPPAYAILNPKQKDDLYPDKTLCGTGVAFKLAQGILAKDRFGVKEGREKWLLDLAGLATIADMVPLVGENRAFAYFGLKVLRKSPRLGLQKLCRKIRINQQYITEDDIGFMIAPRINAASRMDEPMEAFHLLATLDEAEADVRAKHLNKINDQRKGVVASMAREIKKRILEREVLNKVIVVGDPRWKPSLLGLAANSLVEEYKRPVFLWGREGDDRIKGSCRSDGSVDLVKLMKGVGRFLTESGGHAFAGGFSVLHENVHLLEKKLSEVYVKIGQSENSIKSIIVDRRLSLEEVSWETYKIINRLAPFGIGNEKPIFLFANVEIESLRSFGRDGAHLEVSFLKNNNKIIKAIGFFTTVDQYKKVPKKGDKINLIANIERSMFKNYPELRLRIIDIN